MFFRVLKHSVYVYKHYRGHFLLAESQSRYSIVERLTEMKIKIISERLDLDSNLKLKQQKVDQLKKELTDWESDIQQDTERNKRLKQREIERFGIESENAKERKKAKEEALNEKISAIDNALERIEEI